MKKESALIAVDAESAINSLKKLLDSLPQEQLHASLAGRHFYVHPEFSDAVNQLFAPFGHLETERANWPPIKR